MLANPLLSKEGDGYHMCLNKYQLHSWTDLNVYESGNLK
jgi:hypothetical protein